MIIDISDETTWPQETIDCVGGPAGEAILSWEAGKGFCKRVLTRATSSTYEAAHAALWATLQPHSLRGYHSTRLTGAEIRYIEQHGMDLPSPDMLRTRIERLVSDGMLTSSHASKLLSENQAAEPYRAGRLWFCFYEPRRVIQAGIERFFRSWGGEALYVEHERDPQLGPALQVIGTPSIVEAHVPVRSLDLRGGLTWVLVRRYYGRRKTLRTMESKRYEDMCFEPLPSQNIVRIHKFPEPEFLRLSGCLTWNPPLLG